jgi:superoxide reductase
MKRRDFLTTTAGIGAGAILAGTASSAMAQDKPEEKRLQVYKCTECGTISEILVPGTAPIVHCGKPMELLEEQTAPAAENKHVPVIEKIDGGYKVTVGSTAHPMSPTHWIVWIDLIADGKIYRQFLNPGDKPEATFCVDAKKVCAREYCNLHGLWKDK